MRSTDPRALRELAERIRREADHLVLVRLRVARRMSEAARADEDGLREIHEAWTSEQYPALGTASSALRRLSVQLGAAADAAERTSGRRMGGYRGAGYLGTGPSAAGEVRSRAEFFGTLSGARIGGFPLPETSPVRPGRHASEALGEPTPDYDEPDYDEPDCDEPDESPDGAAADD